MSWGALPFWVYEVQYERHLAMLSCATIQELQSGTTRSVPEHVIAIQNYYLDNPKESMQRCSEYDSLV